LKISIKTNFSFAKLANKIPDIISSITSNAAKSSAKESRKAIKSGLSPPLEESTMNVRKSRGISGSTPLFATGTLYNSITSSKEGLTFGAFGKNGKEYGNLQRTGFTPRKIPLTRDGKLIKFINNKNSISVPGRDFVRIGEFDTKNLANKIIKALRK
tara:strand:+ start:303 stop:773 length:471 start_codon:yes stop_codon:yes gene_type:complete